MKAEETQLRTKREDFMSEGFDLRRFLLLSVRRVWVLLPTLAVGMLLFGGGYLLTTVVFADAPLYRCEALYYISFDTKTAQETQLYYNDYTWNAVLDADEIAGVAAAASGIPKEEIAAASFIPTMSDIRMIRLWVDSTTPARAEEIRDALGAALSDFAVRTEGFRSIEQWDGTDAYLQKRDMLLGRWLMFGAVVGLLAGLLLLLYFNAMDDGIYTAEDAERCSGLPVVSVSFADGTADVCYGTPQAGVCVCELTYGMSGRALRARLRSMRIEGRAPEVVRITAANRRFYRLYYADALPTEEGS